MVSIYNQTVEPLQKTERGCTCHHTTLPPFCYAVDNKTDTENGYNYGFTYNFDYGNGYTATVTESLTPDFCFESTCRNVPLIYSDPDGEIVWFIPVIIGAVIGGTSGTIIGHSKGAKGWDMAGYIAISGFVGGGFASAIGGGWGAFAGGSASNLTSQLLYNGGDFSSVNWLSMGISGAASFGLYHGMQYAQYNAMGGKIGGQDITYRQFSKMNTAYQRSRFWRREFGVYLNEDGSAKITPWKDTHKFSVDFRSSKGNIYKTAHSHWAKEGPEWVELPDGTYQRYNSNNSYPSGSSLIETTGGYHSPHDIAGLRGISFVIGRTSSSFLTNSMGGWNYIYPDPYIRFFLFPFLSLKQ